MSSGRHLGIALGGAALVYDPATSAMAPKRVALLLVALGIALATARMRRIPAAMLAWIGCVALTFVHAERPDALCALVAVAIALAALRLPAAQVRSVVQHAAACMALAGVAVAVQALAGRRGSYLHGGQGNPDWLALALAASLPLTLEWAHGGDRRRWAAVAAQLVGLALARSRTAWIAAALAVAVLAHRRWAWAVVAAGAALLPAGTQAALQGRLWIARIAVNLALRHPLRGTAFGAGFAEAQGTRLRGLDLAEAARRFVLPGGAHDDWLQAAVEGGLPAAALLVLAFALAWRAHRDWRAGRAALLAIAASALADAPLHQPAVLVLFALLLAACRSEERASARAPVVAAVGLLLALVVPAWIAERLQTRARDEAPDARATTLALAQRLDATAAIAFDAGLCALERGEPATAVVQLERAGELHWQPATQLALADAWLALASPERALAIDVSLLHLTPGSVRARLACAEALRRLRRDDEARVELARARRVWPSLPAIAALEARLDEQLR